MRARQLIVPIVAAAALTAAACASDDGDDAADEATTADEVNEPVLEEGDDDGSADDGDEAATDVIVLGTDVGEVLATAGNQVLYIFDEDDDGESVCLDGCAELWPPLAADDLTWPESVTAETGSIERPDGIEQATVGGWPVYTYAADGPGDAEGQGVGGVWWVLDPTGSPDRSQP